MPHTLALTRSLEPLIHAGARWFNFLDRHSWDWPEKFQGRHCKVYGTGFSSWGTWAQINAALLVVSSRHWPESTLEHLPAHYRQWSDRRELALSLLSYALGCHTTGRFNTASNNRWGGTIQKPDEKETYDNWHAPLWTSLLGQTILMLGDEAPKAMVDQLRVAAAHDANSIASLGLFNFDGRADEMEGKSSHPESHAWKASLMLLARGLCKDDPQVNVWHERELQLWASSLAQPGDDQSDEVVDGKRVGDLVIGSHLTPSFTVIHHRFLHPCYYVFSLLPRMMAARFCGQLQVDYPQAAARNEAKVFGRLLELYMPGRLVYPAGQDWPRWVYGQAYFLPLVMHRLQVDDDANLRTIAQELIATRLRDAEASDDDSFIIHRFGSTISDNAWHGHRYESDMASSLGMTADLLHRPSKSGQDRPPQPVVTFDRRCHEPMAQTVYERRPAGSLLAMSTRACKGPVQLTAIPADNPHLIEWQGNGSIQCAMRNLMVPTLVELEHSRLELHPQTGWRGQVQIDFGGWPTYRLTPAAFVGRILAHAPANLEGMLVHQQFTANCCAFVDQITLHLWKFAQSPQNQNRRQIISSQGTLHIDTGDTLDQFIDSPWVCVDGSLCLSLLTPEDDPSQTPLRWHLRQKPQGDNPTFHPVLGARWFELSIKVGRPRQERTYIDQLLAQAAIAVTTDGSIITGRFKASQDQVEMCMDGSAGQHQLTWIPTPQA